MGLVVLSTQLDKPEDCILWPEPSGNLHFRSASVGENGEANKLSYLMWGGSAEFVVKEVPAGHYRLVQVNAGIPYGNNLGFEWTEANAPLSFSVKAGEVVYLGELHIALDGYKSGVNCWLGGFKPSLKDQWKRDRALFKKEIKNINPDAVQVRPLASPHPER